MLSQEHPKIAYERKLPSNISLQFTIAITFQKRSVEKTALARQPMPLSQFPPKQAFHGSLKYEIITRLGWDHESLKYFL